MGWRQDRKPLCDLPDPVDIGEDMRGMLQEMHDQEEIENEDLIKAIFSPVLPPSVDLA